MRTLIRNPQEGLGRPFLGLLIGKVPHTILNRELFAAGRPELWQDSNLETAHGEEELWVILRVDANECVIPFNSGERARQALLDVPEDRSSEIDIVLDETHTTVSRPAALVVIADDIVVGRVRICTEVPLNEVPSLFSCKAEQDVEPIDVARIEADWVARFGYGVAILQEIVGHLRRPGHFTGAVQSEDEQIKDEPIVLEDERRELESADQAIGIIVRHVWGNVREDSQTNTITHPYRSMLCYSSL